MPCMACGLVISCLLLSAFCAGNWASSAFWPSRTGQDCIGAHTLGREAYSPTMMRYGDNWVASHSITGSSNLQFLLSIGSQPTSRRASGRNTGDATPCWTALPRKWSAFVAHRWAVLPVGVGLRPNRKRLSCSDRPRGFDSESTLFEVEPSLR